MNDSLPAKSIKPTLCSASFVPPKKAHITSCKLVHSNHKKKKTSRIVAFPTMVWKGEPNRAQDGSRRELKKIEKMSARQVCFSKRRIGLNKKASELTTTCGAEVAILVNSPAGRPYTFGSPAVHPVFNRFLSNNSDEPEHSKNKKCMQSTIDNLNQQSNELSSRLDAARFRWLMLEKRLKQAAEASTLSSWLENIDQLELDPLKQLFESLCQIRARVMTRLNELICAGESSSAQIVNYLDQLAGMMVANVPFASHVVQQHEPRINCQQPSFNPSSRVGLNLDIAPVSNPMTGGFNPGSYEESCAHLVGGSSKEEDATLSTGGFNLGSIRSEMYPLNITAVNEGLIRLNSNSGGSTDADADAETSNNYDFEPLIPLEEFDFTTELAQFVPQIDYTFDDQLFSAEDLIEQNQTDPGTTGSNTNIPPGPCEDEPLW